MFLKEVSYSVFLCVSYRYYYSFDQYFESVFFFYFIFISSFSNCVFLSFFINVNFSFSFSELITSWSAFICLKIHSYCELWDITFSFYFIIFYASDIILICCFGAQETSLIIINVENSCALLKIWTSKCYIHIIRLSTGSCCTFLWGW